MKRAISLLAIALVLCGVGCTPSAPVNTRVQTPPPQPPEHIPLPTPVKPLGVMPTEAEIDKMSEAERENALKEYMAANESVSGGAAAEGMPQGSAQKSGDFKGVVLKVSGSAKIVVDGGVASLVLSDDFKTETGPDLHVYVSGSEDVKVSQDVLVAPSSDLGRLKGTSGGQVYALGGVKVEDVKSVVIYSLPFKVVFGAAVMK